jgi:hypothetical protein
MREVTDCCGSEAREEVFSEASIFQPWKSLLQSRDYAVQKLVRMGRREMADHCLDPQKSVPYLARSRCSFPDMGKDPG